MVTSFLAEVSRGLKHLAEQGILHRDIALRNIDRFVSIDELAGMRVAENDESNRVCRLVCIADSWC